MGAALARRPDDPMTHANQGWALLHEGKPYPAMEHFREALRLLLSGDREVLAVPILPRDYSNDGEPSE